MNVKVIIFFKYSNLSSLHAVFLLALCKIGQKSQHRYLSLNYQEKNNIAGMIFDI